MVTRVMASPFKGIVVRDICPRCSCRSLLSSQGVGLVRQTLSTSPSQTPLRGHEYGVALLAHAFTQSLRFASLRIAWHEEVRAKSAATSDSGAKAFGRQLRQQRLKAAPYTAQEAPKLPKHRSKASRRAYNARQVTDERLAKVMAAAGVASRRACEDIILQGGVTVNGEKILTPATVVNKRRDSIYVNGRQLPKALPQLYFLLNKPKGYICTNDPGGHKTVVDLFESHMEKSAAKTPGAPRPRLFTVGRLDVATTGLLVVTNDGEFAQRIAHPSSNIVREYIVTTTRKATKRELEGLAEGADVDGVRVVPLSVQPLENDPQRSQSRYIIQVAEGRNHEIRKLVAAAGLEVKALKRTRLGPLRLPRDLPVGQFRPLTPKEVALFDKKSPPRR